MEPLNAEKLLLSKIGFSEALDVSAIALEYAVALFRTVLAKRPKTVLEIGMAKGVSTIAILSALSELGGDRLLISIDPKQSSDWGNAGANNVRANGFSSRHRLIEEPDYLALPDLARQRLSLEIAYVDGWHTFDHVLLDFFYIDRMLAVGGLVGFNDCGYRAIHRVLRFIATHRQYTEVDAGIKRTYQARNKVNSLARRLLDRPTSDRWFEKAADWEPAWNFYAPF